MIALASLFPPLAHALPPPSRQTSRPAQARRDSYDPAPRRAPRGPACVPRGVLCVADLPTSWEPLPRTVVR